MGIVKMRKVASRLSFKEGKPLLGLILINRI